MSTRDAIQPRSPWAWLALLPLAVVVAACLRYGLPADIDAGFRSMLAGLLLFEAVLVVVAVRLARRGSLHAWWPVAVTALPAIVGIVAYAGVGTVLAGLLLALAALGIGTRVSDGVRSPAIALLVGLAMLAALVGWLLPFPIHRRWVYLLFAALVIMWRARALAVLLRDSAASLREGASRHPAWAILAIAAATVASLGLWLPSLNYDDNAVHLILQAQLLADGYYHLDVQSQSWAVAPWANNVLHAVAAMLAGHEARAVVAAIWLLLGIDGARRLALALGATPRVALAAAAVFAAQPFTGYFTTTMQVDGASAAILLQLAAVAALPAVQRPGPLAIGAIGGLLLALKTVNLLFASPLLVWLAWSSMPGLRLQWTLRMLAILLPVAASSYAYAVLVTGNPLFPFFNAVFRSPYYPLENMRDLKWMAGVTWRAPWDLLFRSGSFGQYYPGASGVAVLATLPAVLVAAVRKPAMRWLAAWVVLISALLFWQMQYLRYLFPAYAVLAVLGVVALSRLLEWRGFVAAVLLVVAVDAALMPTTSWIVRANPWAGLLRDGPTSRDGLVAEVMPERALLERIIARDPDACALMTDPRRPFVGAGRGHALSMHRRYDPELWRARNAAEADASGVAWRALLGRIGASHVVIDPRKERLLARTLAGMGYVVLDRQGTLESQAAGEEAARRCVPALQVSRDASATLLHRRGSTR
ncbi:MAG TPA: hypothetical protein VLC71_12095 [Thermomonas sp.]|nr:hypothetical protein [Thermomonas sp.]